jgi:IrrE N-terminal-like domain
MSESEFSRSVQSLSSAVRSTGSSRAGIADKAAEYLLSQYKRSGSRDEIPVNLDGLAKSLRCRVEIADSMEGEGRLLPTSTGFTILINPRMPYPRRRVSIAHEMAHTLFYDSQRSNRRIIPATTEEEGFCFDVGRRLLAPRWLLRRAGLYEERAVGAIFRALKVRFLLTRPAAARAILQDHSLVVGLAGVWRRRRSRWEIDFDSLVTSPVLDSADTQLLLRRLSRLINGNRMHAAGLNVLMEPQGSRRGAMGEMFTIFGDSFRSLAMSSHDSPVRGEARVPPTARRG